MYTSFVLKYVPHSPYLGQNAGFHRLIGLEEGESHPAEDFFFFAFANMSIPSITNSGPEFADESKSYCLEIILKIFYKTIKTSKENYNCLNIYL